MLRISYQTCLINFILYMKLGFLRNDDKMTNTVFIFLHRNF